MAAEWDFPLSSACSGTSGFNNFPVCRAKDLKTREMFNCCFIYKLRRANSRKQLEVLWVKCLYFLQFSQQSTLTSSRSFKFKPQPPLLKLLHCKSNGQEMKCCFFCLCTALAWLLDHAIIYFSIFVPAKTKIQTIWIY